MTSSRDSVGRRGLRRGSCRGVGGRCGRGVARPPDSAPPAAGSASSDGRVGGTSGLPARLLSSAGRVLGSLQPRAAPGLCLVDRPGLRRGVGVGNVLGGRGCRGWRGMRGVEDSPRPQRPPHPATGPAAHPPRHASFRVARPSEAVPRPTDRGRVAPLSSSAISTAIRASSPSRTAVSAAASSSIVRTSVAAPIAAAWAREPALVGRRDDEGRRAPRRSSG